MSTNHQAVLSLLTSIHCTRNNPLYSYLDSKPKTIFFSKESLELFRYQKFVDTAPINSSLKYQISLIISELNRERNKVLYFPICNEKTHYVIQIFITGMSRFNLIRVGKIVSP